MKIEKNIFKLSTSCTYRQNNFNLFRCNSCQWCNASWCHTLCGEITPINILMMRHQLNSFLFCEPHKASLNIRLSIWFVLANSMFKS